MRCPVGKDVKFVCLGFCEHIRVAGTGSCPRQTKSAQDGQCGQYAAHSCGQESHLTVPSVTSGWKMESASRSAGARTGAAASRSKAAPDALAGGWPRVAAGLAAGAAEATWA